MKNRTPASDHSASGEPVAPPTGRRRAALWFGALALLSAAVVAATAFTWRNADTSAEERLVRTAQLYTVALEKAVRHLGPRSLARLDEVIADALGADVLGVAFVDEKGKVRASAGALPDEDLGAAPWVTRATRDRRLTTIELDEAFAAAIPTLIGCRPPHPRWDRPGRRRGGGRGWGRFGRGPRGAGPGGPPWAGPPPGPQAGPPPEPSEEGQRDGTPPPLSAPDGSTPDEAGPDDPSGPGGPPPLPPGEPGPEDCRGPRIAVVLLLDPTEARQGVQQARVQAGFVLAVLLLAWVLAWRWQRAQRRAEALAGEARRREKLAALGELAAVLAHEIRNPLGAIRGHAQLAAARLADDERGARSLATVVAETTRLSALVDALLRYARPRPPELHDTDLGALADRVVALVSDEAGAGGVAVDVERPTAGPRAACDADQVEQVLLNLVRNAVQAQPEGGRVAVRVAASGAGAVVRVEDAGPGIPLEDRERVFTPFVTTRAEGTGLGLAIARQIAEAHGGALVAEDSSLGGAALVFTLPGGRT